MAKQSWKPGNMLYPVPAVMISCARENEKPNIITVAWAGTICSDPVMVSISVRKERYSHSIIKETGEFVINLTTKKLKLNYHDSETSFLEGVFARGDRRLGAVLLEAHRLGCQFDGWSDYFQYEKPFLLERMLHNRYKSKNVLNEWYLLESKDVCNFKSTCEDVIRMIDCLKENPFFH